MPSTLTSCAVDRRELGARRQQRREMEDEIDLELRQHPLEQCRDRVIDPVISRSTFLCDDADRAARCRA